MPRACSASISEAQAGSMVCACRLISRLLKWMRCRECRQREAAVGQPRHCRKGAQFKLEKMRADDLAGDADICEARFGTQGERDRGASCQKPFIGRKPFGRPMRAPNLDRLGIRAERFGEMIADARHDQG